MIKDHPKRQIKFLPVNMEDDEDTDPENDEAKVIKMVQQSSLSDKELLNCYKIIIGSEKDSHIADESLFLISLLQQKLDKTKVENFYNTIRLSEQVENMQSLERLKNYQMVQKVKKNCKDADLND